MPSNAADAVGLLRAAMRSANPTIFFEHRSLLMTSDGSARYPGDDYVLPFGKARVLREGTRRHGRDVGRAGASLRRGGGALRRSRRADRPAHDRAVGSGVRAGVGRKTGHCLIVHEDKLTAGFGAEIAATVAQEAFWYLDAPVERLAVSDVPMPYHPVLLDAVLPSVEQIAQRIEQTLRS